MIDFQILGPLRVRCGDDEILVSTPKRRALLALLVLHHGRLVSTDLLVEELWGARPPAQAASSLQAHVSHLRRALGDSAPPIVSQSAGYLLKVEPFRVDRVRFEQLAEEGRIAAARGDHAEAAEQFRAALALWRGRPFDDLPGFAFAERAAESLTQVHLGVVRDRLDAELVLGRHHEVLTELSTLAADHPFDERIAGQLLVALYRSGRQTDALRAYRRTRETLVDELGLEPGPALVDLERAILAHDASLLVPGVGHAQARDTSDSHRAVVTSEARPTGTVTFVFTDIERSTFLWDRHPEAMAGALRLHDALLVDTITEHRGLVFSHGGDGVGAVFDRCVDALAAAVVVQQRVAATDWGDIGPLRVRIALHTGEAEERELNYFGPTLNRASRLRDAGHGGQILVSATTRDLLVEAGTSESIARSAVDDDTGTVSFIDLGSWLFAGVSRPERVYQVNALGLATTFPALRSGRSEAGALPQRATSFVGRDAECAALTALLDEVSLVTLIGDGGIGKTRLAIEVGRHAAGFRPDGVWFCDLSMVTDRVSLEEQVAACLGLVPVAGPDLRQELVRSLRSARLLLVVDNCEHVVATVAELVGEILAGSSDAKVLATSRSPLRVDGERLFAVRPLAVPDLDRPSVAPSPAVTLLTERARAAGAVVRDGDPALREIAVRLDGIPLALELAAPRLTAMSAAALAARLDHRFDLLGGTRHAGPERHRTLRAAVDWSFDLLTPSGRDLFAALSVCASGVTLDAVEALAPSISLAAPSVALVLAHLVDLSMVQLDVAPDGTGRYSMLETMRAYGRDHLEQTGLRPAVLAGHASFFLSLVEHAAHQRRGPDEADAVATVDRDFDNIRVAFRSSVDAGRLGIALRLLHALIDDAIMRNRQEVGRWAEELIAQPALEVEPDRAVAYAVAANAAMVEGRLADAVGRSRCAIELEHLSADEDRPAATTWVARNILVLLGAAGVIDDDWREHLAAMVRPGGPNGPDPDPDPMGAAVALFDQVLIRSLTAHPQRGRPAADELIDLAAKHDNPTMRAMGLLSLARVIGGEDPIGAAATLYEALDLAASVGNTLLTNDITRALAEGEARHGDRAAALNTLRGVLGQFDRVGDLNQQLRSMLGMLDSLLAMEALPLAAMICGGLSRTPWGLTAPCRVVDRVVAERLGAADYATLHAEGARRRPAELIAFAMTEVERLVAEAPPLDVDAVATNVVDLRSHAERPTG